MAPGANIRYYGAASCFDDDFLDTLAGSSTTTRPRSSRNSWGDLERGRAGRQRRGLRAGLPAGRACRASAFLFSSGDNGDEVADTGLKQADYPASDPYVTAVGGTSTGIGQTGKLPFQTGWGTEKYTLSADGKALGRRSAVPVRRRRRLLAAVQPARATRTASSTAATRAGRARTSALDADPTTGMLIGETQTFPTGDALRRVPHRRHEPRLAADGRHRRPSRPSTPGGRLGLRSTRRSTSGQAQLRVQRRRSPTDRRGNVRADFANGINARTASLYSVRTFNQDSSLTTGPGWDDVTGVGTPNSVFLTAFGSGGA